MGALLDPGDKPFVYRGSLGSMATIGPLTRHSSTYRESKVGPPALGEGYCHHPMSLAVRTAIGRHSLSPGPGYTATGYTATGYTATGYTTTGHTTTEHTTTGNTTTGHTTTGHTTTGHIAS